MDQGATSHQPTFASFYFNRFELQLLIERAGLEVLDLWGSHDRRPLSLSSYNMIFVARGPST